MANIGFIGLGIMGKSMAGHLIQGGHTVFLQTRSGVPNDLVALGGIACATPMEAAQHAEMIITMLPDTPDVEKVLFGVNGVTAGLQTAGDNLQIRRTIIDMSTISPLATREFAARINALGHDYVDAPVSGGDVGAQNAALTIMVGADEAVFDKVRPVLELMGKQVTLIGENGAGQICKIANQIIVALTIEAVGEALLFVSKSGADPEKVRQALMGGFAGSRVLEVHGERMINRCFDPGFRIELQQKDLDIVLASASALGISLPSTATAHELYNACIAHGGAKWDNSAIVKMLEKLANHEIEKNHNTLFCKALMPPKDLIHSLRAFLPAEAVLHETEDLRPYECDGLSAYRQTPMIVVLPQTQAQIVQILQLCHATQTPVVARGAGTGLSGGALPHPEGILMSLAKLNQILEIDPLARTARVQPGVRNLAISDAAKPHGLYYAPDPSSQIACSIGGNVAENSGGVHCLKYGLTVHNILKLQMVTIDGEQLEIGGDGLDSPGFDLLALMTGSEGMLGVITEITVKLMPIPEKAQLVMAAFDDIQKAGNAVANVIAAGIIPAGMEMMDKITIHAVEAFLHAGYDLNAQAILLCESDGTIEEVADEIMRINAIMKASGATSISTSRDEAERLRFWAGRKAAFPAAGRVSPDYYCMDGTIPRKHLATVLNGIETLSEEYGLRCMNVFHAGDGNLHPLILYDANTPGELEKTEEFGGKILEMCIHAGGTITGEHGVGMEKINQMCTQFKTNELVIFHGVKAAFDPQGLLNPGKAVPTLHRCAELGAMHVHSGSEKFPELPRF